jgi:hypothetical protein
LIGRGRSGIGQERGDRDGGVGRLVGGAALIAVAGGAVFASAGTAWATNWVLALRSGSAGEAKAQAGPAAPTGVKAACTSSSAATVKVSWTAVSRATAYTIYEATTSATGTYSSVATGVTAVSWTSAALAAGNYWFEVSARTGTNWVGTNSSASGESTISSSGCVQP